MMCRLLKPFLCWFWEVIEALGACISHREPAAPAWREPAQLMLRAGCWPAVKDRHLEKFPCCLACGRKEGVVPHHRIPVHVDASLECDESNLVTMCPKCHLFLGHLGRWDAYNEHVREDSDVHRERVREAYRRFE